MERDRKQEQKRRRDGSYSKSLLPHLVGQPSEEDLTFFHSRMLADGGRVDDRRFENEASDCVLDLSWRANLLLQRLQYPEVKTDKTIFGFVENSRIDGYCRIVDGVALLGVSMGLVQRMYETAHALMCLPDFLPAIGAGEQTPSDGRRGEIARALFPKYPMHGREPRTLVDADPPSLVFAGVASDDAKRRWAAHGLAGVFLQWTLYHEWAHAVSGHVALYDDIFGAEPGHLCLHEAEERAADDAELLQLIEYDADRRASWRIADELLRDQIMLNALTSGTFDSRQLLDGMNVLVAIFFLSLMIRKETAIVGRRTDHPHPAVRYYGIYGRLQEHFKRDAPAMVDDLDDSVKKSVRLVREVQRWSGSEKDPFEPWKTDIETIIGETNRLNQRVNEHLYPKTREQDLFQILSAKKRKEKGTQ